MYGMRFIGPNCIGVINTYPEAPLNATFGPLMPPPGRIGMATQSGALGLAAIDFTAARGLGFSSLVSMGNKAESRCWSAWSTIRSLGQRLRAAPAERSSNS
jgi:acyl-CoA synthetase (NDP forming)